MLKINNEIVTITNDWIIQKNISARGTFDFAVLDKPDISDGDTVEYTAGNKILFKGYIQAHNTVCIAGKGYETTCNAVDLNGYASRRIIIVAEDNKTDEYIIRNKVLPLLSVFGITAGTIEEGQSYSKIRYDYQSCENLLNTFSDNSGYVWYIDNNMKLNYHRRNLIRTDQPELISNFSVNYDSTDYRNIQMLKGGMLISDKLVYTTLKPTPDGECRTFYSVYPVGKLKDLYVNGINITSSVGVMGLDDNKEVYWSYNSKEIEFMSPPQKDTIITIDYYPVMRGIKQIVNSDNVNKKGIFERFIENLDISDVETLNNYSAAQMNKYGEAIERIEFETAGESSNINVGNIVKITNEYYKISDDYLCESITIFPLGVQFLERYIFISGNSVGGWEEYFKPKKRGSVSSVGENETLEIYQGVQEKIIKKGSYVIRDLKSLYCSISLPCSAANKVHRGQKINVDD